jgi:AbrB family looped-hinge helix DNA binding protein
VAGVELREINRRVAGPGLAVMWRRVNNGIDVWFLPFTFAIMTDRLTIDKAGRVVIPKRLRDKLRLVPGDAFQLESTDEQIVLKPLREESTMFKEDGMWVIKTGKPLTVEDVNAVIESVREERHRQILGD